jgi:hypothetical protein
VAPPSPARSICSLPEFKVRPAGGESASAPQKPDILYAESRIDALENAWVSKFHSLPALADECDGGLPKLLTPGLGTVTSGNREQAAAALKLAREVQDVHLLHEDLLAFFGLEDPYLRWSAANCPGQRLEDVRQALGEWRGLLEEYGRESPLSGENRHSFAALCAFAERARAAESVIRNRFRALDRYLRPRAIAVSQPDAPGVPPGAAAA